ncbi:hypothetical protein [Micromonospora sp. NPDC005305]|uniref:hypothetical protein n=1 Tax=Micromonospora sp. NPDC005305 TaxID=3156875 RepID=UPI0033A098B0
MDRACLLPPGGAVHDRRALLLRRLQQDGLRRHRSAELLPRRRLARLKPDVLRAAVADRHVPGQPFGVHADQGPAGTVRAGADRLVGGPGGGTLLGGPGTDVVGGPGDDRLYGGADRDVVVGGGSDLIDQDGPDA